MREPVPAWRWPSRVRARAAPAPPRHREWVVQDGAEQGSGLGMAGGRLLGLALGRGELAERMGGERRSRSLQAGEAQDPVAERVRVGQLTAGQPAVEQRARRTTASAGASFSGCAVRVEGAGDLSGASQGTAESRLIRCRRGSVGGHGRSVRALPCGRPRIAGNGRGWFSPRGQGGWWEPGSSGHVVGPDGRGIPASARRTTPRRTPGTAGRSGSRGRRRRRPGGPPAAAARARLLGDRARAVPVAAPTSHPCTVISSAAVATRRSLARSASPTRTSGRRRGAPDAEQRAGLLLEASRPGASPWTRHQLYGSAGRLGEGVEGVVHVGEQLARASSHGTGYAGRGGRRRTPARATRV